MLATYPPDDFSEDNLVCRLSRRRTFIVYERESPVLLECAKLHNIQSWSPHPETEIGPGCS